WGHAGRSSLDSCPWLLPARERCELPSRLRELRPVLVVELGAPIRGAAHVASPRRWHSCLPGQNDAPVPQALVRTPRYCAQAHVGLRWRPTSLALVARRAGDDDVLPDRLTALGSRDDVLVLELPGRHAAAAVLAKASIARVDVLARELHTPNLRRHRFQEPDDGGDAPLLERTRADCPVVVFENFDLLAPVLAAAEQDERTLPGDPVVGRAHLR